MPILSSFCLCQTYFASPSMLFALFIQPLIDQIFIINSPPRLPSSSWMPVIRKALRHNRESLRNFYQFHEKAEKQYRDEWRLDFSCNPIIVRHFTPMFDLRQLNIQQLKSRELFSWMLPFLWLFRLKMHFRCMQNRLYEILDWIAMKFDYFKGNLCELSSYWCFIDAGFE